MSEDSKVDPATVTAILEAVRQDRRAEAAEKIDVGNVGKWSDTLQSVGKLAAVLVVLIGAGFTYKAELDDKPTKGEMSSAVKVAVEPVKAAAEEASQASDRANRRVDRIEDVVEYQVEFSIWQADVTDHVRRRQKPPGKPDALKKKETQLLLIGQDK